MCKRECLNECSRCVIADALRLNSKTVILESPSNNLEKLPLTEVFADVLIKEVPPSDTT